MNNKYLIILFIAIIIALIIGCGIVMSPAAKKDCKINVISNDTLYENDNVTINISDLNNAPIGNVSVRMQILNGSDVVLDESIKTDAYGQCNITLENISTGNYTINITFEGNNKYNGNMTVSNLTIIESISKTAPTTDYSTENHGSHQSSSSRKSDYDDGIVYTTEDVLDENGKYDMDKVQYYNQKASEKYGPIG